MFDANLIIFSVLSKKNRILYKDVISNYEKLIFQKEKQDEILSIIHLDFCYN